MVLPQVVPENANTTVKVTYHVRYSDGKTVIPDPVIFDLSKDDDFEFNVNTQYHFQFAFNAQGGITFNPEVDDYWDDVRVRLDPIPVKAANTYMVKPDGWPIVIPVYSGNPSGASGGVTDATSVDYGQVSHAMFLGATADGSDEPSKLGDDWLDNANLKVGILWTDVDPAISTVVEKVQLTGTPAGNDLKIIVTPGVDTGNALVILYDDANGDGNYDSGGAELIKWSWLIWNVDYTPVPGVSGTALADGTPGFWMDRNLGATTNSAGSSTVYGFMYQWGRPHPLNHAEYDNSSGTPENFYVYNDGTAGSTAPVSVDATSSVTISTWVNEPITRYYAGQNGSGMSTRSTILWLDTYKSVFDPCPTGWRVPTPNMVGHDEYWEAYAPKAGNWSNNSNTTVNAVTSNAYFWVTRNLGSTTSYAFERIDVNDDSLFTNFHFSSEGMSVRCVVLE
jgi:hypothetical protein